VNLEHCVVAASGRILCGVFRACIECHVNTNFLKKGKKKDVKYRRNLKHLEKINVLN